MIAYNALVENELYQLWRQMIDVQHHVAGWAPARWTLLIQPDGSGSIAHDNFLMAAWHTPDAAHAACRDAINAFRADAERTAQQREEHDDNEHAGRGLAHDADLPALRRGDERPDDELL